MLCNVLFMAPRIKIDTGSNFTYSGADFVKHLPRFKLLLQICRSRLKLRTCFTKSDPKVGKFNIKSVIIIQLCPTLFCSIPAREALCSSRLLPFLTHSVCLLFLSDMYWSVWHVPVVFDCFLLPRFTHVTLPSGFFSPRLKPFGTSEKVSVDGLKH